MQKEVPVWVAVLVILVVILVVVGVYFRAMRPRPVEPFPIEQGGAPVTARPGGPSPTGQPPGPR